MVGCPDESCESAATWLPLQPSQSQTWVNGTVASKTVLDDLSKGFDTSGRLQSDGFYMVFQYFPICREMALSLSLSTGAAAGEGKKWGLWAGSGLQRHIFKTTTWGNTSAGHGGNIVDEWQWWQFSSRSWDLSTLSMQLFGSSSSMTSRLAMTSIEMATWPTNQPLLPFWED